ncbi:imidazole glycerol phosphate synthase subunit HisH [Roseivivax sp.]
MTQPACAIIDYGIGNVFSVRRALEQIGVEAELTADPDRILAADRVILPGVGAFGRAMEKLRQDGLDRVIHDYVASGKPFLGICIGLQVLMETSEEFGSHTGLGLIPGRVRKIPVEEDAATNFRVPFIGWSPVAESRSGAWQGTPLQEAPDPNAFYFVHSYEAVVSEPDHLIATHTLGGREITSAVRRDNVLGVQFHPERSADHGLRFLEAFVNL